MNDSRKKMLEKVKAILAKTMDNGCTESEAMAALAKARELMATYEIDESELNKFEQENATLHKTGFADPYDIKKNLAMSVGKFTRTAGFNGVKMKWGISFCGLESDVIFATWLLDTLQRFVMRALREFQKQRSIKGLSNSNHTSHSFVVGCTIRIAEKLKELTPADNAKNKDIIVAELAKNGVVLRKSRADGREIDERSAQAGHQAGGSARFDRPVESGGTLRLK
jgi:Protein of unknown function (DUF2786)